MFASPFNEVIFNGFFISSVVLEVNCDPRGILMRWV